MPKSPRSAKEIEIIRTRILNQAIQMMAEEGYHGFSMRKLAKPLNITAKTIYNYYRNKDQLYLAILTCGFERLHDKCQKAYVSNKDPYERMDRMLEAYLYFGIQENNFYNLMFTWHVPKYNDYLGTDLEPSAKQELDAALACPKLFVRALKACNPICTHLSDEKSHQVIVHIWTQIHGYLAGLNNTLLDYMLSDPLSFKDQILDHVKQFYRTALK